MEQHDALAAHLVGWDHGTGPLYERLAAALTDALDSSHVPAGGRVPAERRLAAALGISRTTVVSAYNLLRQDGRLSGEVGSGTYVLGPTPRRSEPVGRTQITSPMVNLSRSVPAALEGDLRDALRSALDDLDWVSSGMATLGTPQGLTDLRVAVADLYSSRGLATSERQVLITSGAQQALALYARSEVDLGASVVCESPTYHGAVDAFAARGVQFAWAEAGDGVALVDAAAAAGSDLIYSIPGCHYVTGSRMGPDGRAALIEFAESGGTVIDDDILAGLVLTDDPRPLAAEAPGARIVTLGSMSKMFLPGLRVGWLRADEPTVARLVREKNVEDQGTSVLAQVVALHLLGRRDSVRAARRAEIDACRQVVMREVRRLLPAWSFVEPDGGRSIWIRIDGSATDFAQVALHHGVAVTPSAMLGPTEHDDHIRIVFVQPPETLLEGISRLALAWAAYVDGRAGGGDGARPVGVH